LTDAAVSAAFSDVGVSREKGGPAPQGGTAPRLNRQPDRKADPGSPIRTSGASASREQQTGVEQITHAMSRVDHVTQRNSASAEELSATAEELSGQAATQQKLVAYFQVAGEDTARG